MSLTIAFEQLLDYTDHERLKWRAWVATDPARLDIVVQPGGRFPTVGKRPPGCTTISSRAGSVATHARHFNRS